jgi:hypothetical protein
MSRSKAFWKITETNQSPGSGPLHAAVDICDSLAWEERPALAGGDRCSSTNSAGCARFPVQDAYGCTLAAVTAADLGEGWVRWDCDWPGCTEHLRFWAPLGDPEREGWAMHVAVTPERQDAELAPRHYCPAHAKGP